jgi:hypothetical protein
MSDIFSSVLADVRKFPVEGDTLEWLSLVDICRVLWLQNPSMVARTIPEKDKRLLRLDPAVHGAPSMIVIEPGAALGVIFSSRTVQARKHSGAFCAAISNMLRLQHGGAMRVGASASPLPTADTLQSNSSCLAIGDFFIRQYAFIGERFLMFSGRDFYTIRAKYLQESLDSIDLRVLRRDTIGRSIPTVDTDGKEDIAMDAALLAFWLTPAYTGKFWYKLHESLGVEQIPRKSLQRRLTEALTIPNRDYVA